MSERDWNGRESRDWNDGDSGSGWNKAADAKAIGTIDHYELLRELGTGGFGSVYLARDAVSRTFVAVKGLPQQVSDSASELERIRANYALVSKLKHPNVAAVLALHRVGAVACGDPEVLRKLNVKSGDTLLVMDYAPGVTLDTWCRQFQDRRVPVDQAVEVTRQIAAALDVAHKMKIVHRDIKPQNVMVETLSDGTFTARVLDFGLAAEVRSSINRVSKEERKDSSGTLQYMAPEQLDGRRANAAMDQYALAALFFELVTGDVPFSSVFECGDKGIIINVVTTKPPEMPEGLPRPVRKALARALAKEPKERFATCGDFVAALQGVAQIRWGLVTGILATVAVVGVGAWWLGRSRAPVSVELGKPSVDSAASLAPAASSATVRPVAIKQMTGNLNGGVQLWKDGPYWAECNVGATKPEECGYYFWWGDTTGYRRNADGDGWVSVSDSMSFEFTSDNCPTAGKSNSQLRSDGYIDATDNLVAKCDAATAHLGEPWRMPTGAELFAIDKNCTTTWTTRNGVTGRLVTGKGAYSSKSIFLPAAGYGNSSSILIDGKNGYYWSSSPSGSIYARYLNFDSYIFLGSSYSRYYGYPVRPVRGFAK